MNHRYTIVTLSELLAVARHCERGYSSCAGHARVQAIRRSFAIRASKHSAAAGELGELIAQLGGNPSQRAKIPGESRRGWSNLHAALSQNEDEALLEECERGDDHALEVYRNALDDHLPDFVRQVVLRQFEELMEDHDQIRFLRSDPLQAGRVAVSAGGHARP